MCLLKFLKQIDTLENWTALLNRNGGTKLRVVAGILNLNTEGSDEQIRMVKATYIHPNYNPPNFANDVAIIEV